MFDVVVIGHLLKEYIKFSDGRELGPVLGSPCAYTSVAAAHLGLKVGIVTKIGPDMPQELLGVFEDSGVDTQGVVMDKCTTTNSLAYDKSGEKQLTFMQKAAEVFFQDIPSAYLDAKMFLLCPIDYETGPDLLEKLHDSGKGRLSMELSGFGGASSSGRGDFIEQRQQYLRDIVRYFEIVKAGQEDCMRVFGADGEKNLEGIARKLTEWGAKIAVITRGEDGAMAYSKDTGFTCCDAIECKVEDLTGAGDVFHAGFIAEYLRSGDIEKSLVKGMTVSSFVIARTGGVSPQRFTDLSPRNIEARIQEDIKT